MENEADVINRIKSGDKTAFEELLNAYSEKVYVFALHLTGNREEAKDLAQDILVSVYKNIDKFRQESSLLTWIYRISVNLWKNIISSKKRRNLLAFLSLEELIENKGLKERDETADQLPENEILRKQKNLDVWKILYQLREKDREALVMRDMEGRSYEEISQILQIPLGTVKWRIANARFNFREKYRSGLNE